jgi:uncharacterized membrane protein (UPF0182 family)
MAETLNKGLVQIFGRKVESALAPDLREVAEPDLRSITPVTDPEAVLPVTDLAALAVQANDTFKRLVAAQRAGDWALYGEELKKLEEVLAAMDKIRK